jgi:hypothetical protein
MTQDVVPPQPLRHYDQWICWNPVFRENGKVDKVPAFGASVTDPLCWLNYENAAATKGQNLGFVFTQDDPFVFIDIDNCATSNNGWNDDAAHAYTALPGATWERSQSGTGLHAVLYAPDAHRTLAHKRNRFTLPGGTKAEMYTHARFMALGGDSWFGTLDMTTDATQALLAWLPDRETSNVATHDAPLTDGPRAGYNGPTDDDALISKARKAAGSAATAFGERATFEQLWTADAQALGTYFPSDSDAPFDHSAADAALMSALAWWTGCDETRMERLFTLSALGARDKWKERADYRTSTIRRVTPPDRKYTGHERKASEPKTPPPDDPDLWVPHVDVIDKNNPLAMCHVAHHDLGADIRWCEFRLAQIVNGEKMTDARAIQLWIEGCAKAQAQFGKDKFMDAMFYMASRRPMHPVRDYLATCQNVWDGVARLDTWLIDYAKAPDTPYVRGVSAKTLIAAVRRVRKPGHKHDEMLVLEGEQGLGKSTLFETLCPDPSWFSDNVTLSMDTKEMMEATLGRWFVEAPELSKLNGAEIEHVKALLSRKVDSARLAYGRHTTDAPRQFVIVGTTNAEEYLLDQTGNRRFWPVRVARVDLQGLTEARDQIWAEAAYREAAGESNMLPESLWNAAAQEQAQRMHANPYTAALMQQLGEKTGTVSMTHLCEVLGLRVRERRAAYRDIRAAMDALGWRYDRATRDFIRGGAARRIVCRGGTLMDETPQLGAVK